MARTASTESRTGRLPENERSARRENILDCALEELLDRGVDGLTMLGVAKRAGASKETLYSWFGNRNGLLTALIKRNGDGSIARIREGLDRDASPRDSLIGFATGLLSLLTGEASIALNRAAMASPELAELLLESGRHRVGPIVEEYLSFLDAEGSISAPDAEAAFEMLYGLVIQDTQIRVLLGDPAPRRNEIEARATKAVDHFLTLTSPTAGVGSEPVDEATRETVGLLQGRSHRTGQR